MLIESKQNQDAVNLPTALTRVTAVIFTYVGNAVTFGCTTATMKFRSILILIALLLLSSGGAATVRAQKLILFDDNDKYGYKNALGKIVIPAKFSIAGDFAKNNLAGVLDNQGW